jgi:hypothetical protein
VLHLYALTGAPALVPPTPGFDGAALEVVRVGELDAVVSPAEGESVPQTEAAILLHAGVVDDLAALNDAVLPARFGRAYRDRDALREAVGAHAPALVEALDRVRGCVELGLRVAATETAAAPAVATGSDYMRARLGEQRRTAGLAEAVHAPLAALARASTRSVGVTPRLLLSGSYLVERGEVDAVRAAVERLGRDHPELTLVLTGPWPPYSFATMDGAT